MRIRDILRSEKEIPAEEVDLHLEGSADDESVDSVSREDALKIPSVYECVELIADTIANLEVKLYCQNGSDVEELDDVRVRLLNDDSRNYMTGVEMKKAIIRDYLLDGVFYIYVNKAGNSVKSLHYVESNKISVIPSIDPIFRDFAIYVGADRYELYNFITMTKNTVNGVEGLGVVAECNSILKQALDNMNYTSKTMGNGGVKRGVLQSTRRLTADGITELKNAWKRLYTNNNDCIVLNEGITYKELQQTGAEMQMIEGKRSIDDDVCKLFNVPPALFGGNLNDDVWNLFVKMAISPIIGRIESALNKNLLLETEKGSFYFAFDTKQLNKGDIEKRFKAYELALKNSFMSPAEVRYEEDLPEVAGLDFIKFNLGDVLMNMKTGEIYTPNTDSTVDATGTLKGGEKDETGIKE